MVGQRRFPPPSLGAFDVPLAILHWLWRASLSIYRSDFRRCYIPKRRGPFLRHFWLDQQTHRATWPRSPSRPCQWGPPRLLSLLVDVEVRDENWMSRAGRKGTRRSLDSVDSRGIKQSFYLGALNVFPIAICARYASLACFTSRTPWCRSE